MGRVTRAAARADPILADETTAVAEIALSEDPASVELPQSPVKVSERAPLGEIKGNDQGSVAATAAGASPVHSSNLQESSDNADVSSQDSGTSDSENRVVLVLGADENAKVKETKQKKMRATGAGKKSVKKNKATAASKPSPEVVEQMRQTLEENVKNFKGGASKKASIKKAGCKRKVLDDNEAASQSDASSEAAEMLMDNTSPSEYRQSGEQLWRDQRAQITPLAENGEAAPSPAVVETKKQLNKAAATQAMPSVAINTDSKPTSEIAAVAEKFPANPVDDNAPNAVQKLAMLFQPEPVSTEKCKERGTLGHIVSGEIETNGPATTSGIEALDALEEDIETVEKSLPVLAKKASPMKLAKTTGPVKSAVSKKSSPAGTGQSSRPSGTTARKTLNQTISPTDGAIERKKRNIEALNTPQKLKKSDKPPTISKFQLSSEATAARLKAQREERQKRREEEEKIQKTLKAKPAPRHAKPVEVRPTATSRARMSLVAAKPREGEANSNAKAKTVGRVSTGGLSRATATSRRPSTLGARPSVTGARPSVTGARPQVQNAATRPKPSPEKTVTPRTVPKSPRLSTLARSSRPSGFSPVKKMASNPAGQAPRPSMSKTTVKRTSLKPELAHATNATKNVQGRQGAKRTSTVKGKEVFNRDKVEKEERERTQKEKMDSATKARLEAAERGRAASKAWAEKKKQLSEASKSRSTSGASDAVQTAASRATGPGDDSKQAVAANVYSIADKLQTLKEEPSGGMAFNILQNGEMSQDDAAYIVAEMERINEVRQSTGGQGIAIEL